MAEALNRMLFGGFWHLPVTGGDAVVGMVSMRDLARSIAEHRASRRAKPHRLVQNPARRPSVRGCGVSRGAGADVRGDLPGMLPSCSGRLPTGQRGGVGTLRAAAALRWGRPARTPSGTSMKTSPRSGGRPHCESAPIGRGGGSVSGRLDRCRGVMDATSSFSRSM